MLFPLHHPQLPDPVLWMLLAFAPLLGACVGSFLNVVVYRLPREHLSVVYPGSHCFFCGSNLAWFDNIPVLSWLALGGKCRSCRVKISPIYLLTEVVTGLVFFGVCLAFAARWFNFARFDPSYPARLLAPWQLGPATATDQIAALSVYLIVISALIAASWIDFRHRIIPDEISVRGSFLMPLVACAFPIVLGPSAALPRVEIANPHLAALVASAAGAIVGAGTVWLVGVFGRWLFAKEAMGMGDVKLMGLLGGLLGWKGILLTLFVACLGGALIGGGLMVLTWLYRKLAGLEDAVDNYLPFGPYLAAAAVLVLIFEPSVVELMISLTDGVQWAARQLVGAPR